MNLIQTLPKLTLGHPQTVRKVHVTEIGANRHRAIMRSISGLLIGTFFATLSTNILATALPRILASLRVSVDGYT